jgi:hypothetical protein
MAGGQFCEFLETVVVVTGIEKILVVLFLTIFLSPLLLTKFFTDWGEKGEHERI